MGENICISKQFYLFLRLFNFESTNSFLSTDSFLHYTTAYLIEQSHLFICVAFPYFRIAAISSF